MQQGEHGLFARFETGILMTHEQLYFLKYNYNYDSKDNRQFVSAPKTIRRWRGHVV